MNTKNVVIIVLVGLLVITGLYAFFAHRGNISNADYKRALRAEQAKSDSLFASIKRNDELIKENDLLVNKLNAKDSVLELVIRRNNSQIVRLNEILNQRLNAVDTFSSADIVRYFTDL